MLRFYLDTSLFFAEAPLIFYKDKNLILQKKQTIISILHKNQIIGLTLFHDSRRDGYTLILSNVPTAPSHENIRHRT